LEIDFLPSFALGMSERRSREISAHTFVLVPVRRRRVLRNPTGRSVVALLMKTSLLISTDIDSPYWVYSFAPHRGGGDLAKIGAAIPHLDGNGFDIILDALPFTANLVVRRAAANQRKKGGEQSLAAQVESFERALIEECLIEARGVIRAVMERLDIPRRTLNEKMARYGIDRRQLLELGSPKPKSKIGGRSAKRVEQMPDHAKAGQRTIRRPRRSASSAPDIQQNLRLPAEGPTSK